MLTLVASALAGGDCIDDADALRAGGTAGILGCVVKAPSTLGTFLRNFRWEHVRQLDRVSRQLLARVWQAEAGPGDAPPSIWTPTICETSPLTHAAIVRGCVGCVFRSIGHGHQLTSCAARRFAARNADIGVRSIRPRRVL